MSPAPVIIAIDGRSGAGKTTLAIELAATLREHHKVSLFHLEDIYPGWNGLVAGVERYVSTVLAPLHRSEPAEWVSWDWTAHYDGATRTTQPAEIVLVEGVGAAAAAALPFLAAVIWADSPEQDRRSRALARDGETYEPFWDKWAAQEQEWLAGDDVPARADVRVLNRADGAAPAEVLQSLLYLPALAPVLLPERSARTGLELQAERIDAVPDPVLVFEALFGGSANAVWLDSSLTPVAPDGGAAAERSRFSILADDGGPYGQSVRHNSGTTCVSVGNASVTTEGPFFRWLDGVWGQPTLRGPKDYPCGFTLGWLGYLGYELKRETGGSDAPAGTPDACLLFAGRAVVLDHVERTVWLLALGAADAGDWLATARSAITEASNRKPAGAGHVLEPRAPGHGGPDFTARDSEASYKFKISRAQHEITEGNSYEVCLTTALTANLPAATLEPWQAYLMLRRGNPAPFASYLRFGDLTVASTSPERFLRIAPDG
ncbi:MAG: chorismate-binding protein, partial [Arthrobacter sp.]